MRNDTNYFQKKLWVARTWWNFRLDSIYVFSAVWKVFGYCSFQNQYTKIYRVPKIDVKIYSENFEEIGQSKVEFDEYHWSIKQKKKKKNHQIDLFMIRGHQIRWFFKQKVE